MTGWHAPAAVQRLFLRVALARLCAFPGSVLHISGRLQARDRSTRGGMIARAAAIAAPGDQARSVAAEGFDPFDDEVAHAAASQHTSPDVATRYRGVLVAQTPSWRAKSRHPVNPT